MSTSIYAGMSPRDEAHLMNSSAWLTREDTVLLGCYAEVDNETGECEQYVLYALESPLDTGFVSFGAHYGERGDQYLSHPMYVNRPDPHFCGSSRAINVAIVRYLLLQTQSK